MNIQYESERLFLTRLTSSHAAEVCQFYVENSAFFDPYELTRPKNFYTVSFHKLVLDWEWKEMQEMKCLRFFLFQKNDSTRIIGTINVSNIRMGCLKKASIGYKIDHRYWDQGYAKEACNTILDILFLELGLHRIEAEIMPSNQPSLRLIESLGFTKEGLEREAGEINGKWEDHYLYAKLNPYH